MKAASRIAIAASVWLMIASPLTHAAATALDACPESSAEAVTGLPLPRLASIRKDANLRQGPSLQHPILSRTVEEASVMVRRECLLWRLIQTEDGHEAWTHAMQLRPNRQP